MNLEALKTLYNALWHLERVETSPKSLFISRKLLLDAVYRVKQTVRTADLLTPAERSRLSTVREATANGVNPYEKRNDNTTKDLGGLDKDRAARIAERLKEKESVSEVVFNRLTAKWKERPEHIKVGDLDIDLGPFVEKDPTKVYCSYCDTEVDLINATYGSGRPIKKIIIETIWVAGRRQLKETQVHFTPKLVACPNCVLHLHATFIDRNGERQNQNKIKFPDFD